MGEVRTVRMGDAASAAIPKLWRAMRDREWSQGHLAKQVGTTSSVVNRWLHGDRRPGRRFADRLESLLGLDVALWDQPLSSRFELKRTA